MKKSILYSLLAAALLAAVAFFFFFPDDVQGNVLQQHDIMQGLANGQEGKAFTEATGETTRWTDSLFGGMPNFQIAPSYPANNLLDWIVKVYTLGLPSPANLLFGMMLGFFIMCLCFPMKWPTALFAALAWGFSSYFIIIIGAGHIWKFLTLAFIPPTIGGLALLYRGRYLPGLALTALFGALQLQSNHPQMSYYFMLVILCLVVGWLYAAWKSNTLARWAKATACAAIAGALAVGANSASLYNSLEYSKETVRGKATELTLNANADNSTGGMDRAAITAWSYSPAETFSLLIPNVKGGATIKPVGGDNKLLPAIDTPKGKEVALSAEEAQWASQFPQYFGDQPMTNGPVYVGAFVLLLAILAIFTVNGTVATPLKWSLLTASVLAIILSWGHNLPAVTNFFIDNFPGYNKFRAVASILVVVEFCVPLLAAMVIGQMLRQPDYFRKYSTTILAVFGTGAVICLTAWIAPEVFGSPYSASEREFITANGIAAHPAYASVLKAVSEGRLGLVSADGLRSFLYILGAWLILWCWGKGMLGKPSIWVLSLSALALLDLYGVGKRYVNTDNFVAPAEQHLAFEPTEADRIILQDTTHYRVMDVDGFSQARSSYFHNTIGGYHAAKLTRYNDLIEHQIMRNNPEVLNMLNAKYFISQGEAIRNPDALGNAWLVDSIEYVDGADAEMAALDSLPAARMAVADTKFSHTLGTASLRQPGDTIWQTSYAPNHLTYRSNTSRDNVAVFSEIFFPWGWEATVDGKPVEIGRVNYVLRALRIPAGKHDIDFRFDPKSLRTTNTISMICVIGIYVLGVLALVYAFLLIRKSGNGTLAPKIRFR